LAAGGWASTARGAIRSREERRRFIGISGGEKGADAGAKLHAPTARSGS